MGRLTVFLPCKPDRGQRSVPLAQSSGVITMAGCEAGGALFAASHIQVANASDVEPTLQAWRAATLANLQAQDVVQSGPPTFASPLRVNGVRATGEPVQAQLAWQVAGTDLFHVAVYAEKIKPELTETLFTQAKIQ